MPVHPVSSSVAVLQRSVTGSQTPTAQSLLPVQETPYPAFNVSSPRPGHSLAAGAHEHDALQISPLDVHAAVLAPSHSSPVSMTSSPQSAASQLVRHAFGVVSELEPPSSHSSTPVNTIPS